MTKLKFDKDGFLLPQKISYKVENEEEIEESIKKTKEEKENANLF